MYFSRRFRCALYNNAIAIPRILPAGTRVIRFSGALATIIFHLFVTSRRCRRIPCSPNNTYTHPPCTCPTLIINSHVYYVPGNTIIQRYRTTVLVQTRPGGYDVVVYLGNVCMYINRGITHFRHIKHACNVCTRTCNCKRCINVDRVSIIIIIIIIIFFSSLPDDIPAGRVRKPVRASRSDRLPATYLS